MIQRILLGGFAAIFIGLGVATLLFGMQLPDFPHGITGKITDSLPPPNITPPRVQLDWQPRTNNTPGVLPETPREEPEQPPIPSSGGRTGGSRGSGSSSSSVQQDTREIVTLTVRVDNVTRLAGAQFEIRYSASATQLRTITEGPFLDNGSVSNAMLVNTVLDAQAGQLVAVFRLMQGSVSGSGVLMTATFATDNSDDIIVTAPMLSNDNTQTVPASSLSWTIS